jgi:uncharacterized membrane protein
MWQSAFLAIFTMLLAVLLINLAAYTVTAIYTSLTSAPTVSSSSKLRASDCECRCSHLEPQKDWFALAPGTTQLCFMANLGLGMASGVLLVVASFWWMTSVSEVSVSARNYALGCGIGAGIVGLVLVHVLFMKRFVEGGGLMMAVNTILGLALTGLAFGTME